MDAQSVGKETPLMRAVSFGCRDAVRVLLQAGANPYLFNICGQNAMSIASPRGAATEMLTLIQ